MIVEEGVERLKELELLNKCDEIVFFGYRRKLYIYEYICDCI